VNRVLHRSLLALAAVAALLGEAHAEPGFRFDPPAGSAPAAAFFESNGWEEQRGHWDNWRFEGGALHTRQDGDSTSVGRRVDLDPEATPILRFSFAVEVQPRGADLSRKAREDSALRVFVVFDRGGGLLSPPDSIAYAFGDPAAIGEVLTSERFDNVKYVVVAGGDDQLGRRLLIERNLAKDYREVFGRDAPRIKGIAIKSDANNLKGRASAVIYGVEVTAH